MPTCDFHYGILADVLARQCSSARKVQSWWRSRCARSAAKVACTQKEASLAIPASLSAEQSFAVRRIQRFWRRCQTSEDHLGALFDEISIAAVMSSGTETQSSSFWTDMEKQLEDDGSIHGSAFQRSWCMFDSTELKRGDPRPTGRCCSFCQSRQHVQNCPILGVRLCRKCYPRKQRPGIPS